MFALNYKNILLKHNKCIISSRSECDVSTEIAGKTIKCPVVPSNMPAILNRDMCCVFDNSGWFYIYPRQGGFEDICSFIRLANKENWNFVSISLGVKDEDYKIIDYIIENNLRVDSICIDVALSWQDSVAKIVGYINKNFKKRPSLIVGNGDNPEWIRWLIGLGVNVAKINIGVSEACRTRQYTGFGSTTVTDLVNCSMAANGEIKIMADGGLTIENGEVWIGDISKAIALNADYVMSGSLFADCSDSLAQTGLYYGNSTAKAKGYNYHIEGAAVKPKNCGLTTFQKMDRIIESLKSSVSYSGGTSLADLRKVKFQLVN